VRGNSTGSGFAEIGPFEDVGSSVVDVVGLGRGGKGDSGGGIVEVIV
jgi:hypothetical protein